MSWAITATVGSTLLSAGAGAYQAHQQGKADAAARAANEANIRAALGEIQIGREEAELRLDEIFQLAQRRAGEEGRVSADYTKAEKQLEEGHKKSMGRLAGAEGQMGQQMQAMFESALGGAVGGSPRAAMGGGSMAMNLARMAGGEVARSGMPLELAKMASAQEAQYGTQQAGLTQAKSGATSRAREQYLGGMQQAQQSYADLAKWQADKTSSFRSGVQYQAAEAPDYFQGVDFSALLGLF